MSLGNRRRLMGIADELNGFMDVEKTAVSQGFYEVASNVITLTPTIKTWNPIRPRFKKPIKLKQNDVLTVKIVECTAVRYADLVVKKSDGDSIPVAMNFVCAKGNNYSINISSDCEIVAISFYVTNAGIDQITIVSFSFFVNDIQVI